MTASEMSEIEKVRDSSRRIVRELGFMKPTLASTGLPASAVHALIEIGGNDALAAGTLAEILNLEKSSVSRMLRKLVDAGEIEERPNPDDARSKLLTLTTRGRATLAAIDNFGKSQVAGAFRHLSDDQRRIVVAGLIAYAEALQHVRRADNAPNASGTG
ncbi:MarR family winged helix-turn-helix transcriptional regulator [Aquamicrobium sp. LC103]|uniref:MarR family winged helix-turn-helix transcriptional regulator n=1 Tax=Aquamicrobium sp. LC103 TaxID=1120658 RepID=UPI0009E1FFD2|nr:MarR family winged helix-turn-helix transcriptional regulator [Aquamicrobium sp. LC103]TKT74157.1 winged helix-turn-helix transcriptional regulator [Aquamicrobium sp. LC103]